MSTREVTDPYKGVKYSDIINANAENRRIYRDTIPPLLRVAGSGRAYWDAENGRYVI